MEEDNRHRHNYEYEEKAPRQAMLNVPMAILIAAIIIGGAVVWTFRPSAAGGQNGNGGSGAGSSNAANAATAAADAAAVVNGTANPNLKPVSAADHILGNPNAPVKIVEFSDPSCPYCKMFNPTMWQIMNDYGSGGQVAWVYRSFPLNKPDANGNILHPNAGHEAQALECAATLGGNDTFWAYEKELYTVTPSVTPQTPKGLDQNQLPVIAKDVGLNVAAFNTCLASGQEAATVEAQYQDGLAAGVAGTPFSFIITPSGTLIPLPGVEPYATIKNAIEILVGSSTEAGN
jgi:protein-disulfide isomerase